MDVTIKYFAWMRERVGVSEERVALPAHVATVADVVAWLTMRGENYAAAFAKPHLTRAAVDQVHASHETCVLGAREIAFFPPVTGG
ncbi:molybdopterin converting factor, subunit 1 [Rhodomicrobium vannielii ATCC 17100]|jgi:sulfur-carrier protein|uniref:Molybdopterin converting factor, subunit 1 n=1 Tax=Rhodomicrobium vannielii (strain ATCC 17100 / DSM 162 / LMG 4299 / NCIMB 10020 / ATH 3.1.1) TaxID=648757 RepID=E3I533_RHOVT|nr:molybdopterin converting factor subunit 1 [Rhodomicrobium vannielii]ADP69387.1 molybdopterin converting factor, subunit 1 [Rhodomicrobium vannielii ATCC 17100]